MSTLDFHFIHRFHQQVQALSHHPALRFMQDEKWSEISWLELQKQVNNLSYALLANGLAVQEKIAIFAQNMPRWTITDIAAMQIRAVAVPIYATSTTKQLEYILNDGDIKSSLLAIRNNMIKP